MAFDLAQRRDQGGGIFGQLDRFRVGDIFARRADRRARAIADAQRQLGEEGDQQNQRNENRQQHHPDRLAPVVELHPPPGLGQEQRRHERIGRCEQHGVAMLDVGHFVRQHRRQLIIIEAVDQPAGGDHHHVVGADPAGERVERGRVDHRGVGNGDAGGDRQRFENPAEARLVVIVDVAEADAFLDRADEPPQLGGIDHQPNQRDRQAIASEIAERRDQRIVARIVEHRRHDQDDQRHQFDGDDESAKQQQRAFPVFLDVAVKPGRRPRQHGLARKPS